jgi:hypothetical protein
MQQISCIKGKCFEKDTIEDELDSIYDKDNYAQRIELDILKRMIR